MSQIGTIRVLRTRYVRGPLNYITEGQIVATEDEARQMVAAPMKRGVYQVDAEILVEAKGWPGGAKWDRFASRKR